MAGLTLAQADAQLQLYLAAEAAALKNQSYEIAGRKLTRANLAEIREGVKYWSHEVKVLQQRASGRGRSRTVVVGF